MSTPVHMTRAAPLPRAFAHVRDWVFDLDNTLYCASRGLFEQIDARMTAYLGRLFDTDATTARVIQKEYYHRHGTTLRGLIVNGEIADPDDFLAFVHDIDYSVIEADPALDTVLAALRGRRWVFTNGSLAHARAVLERLGVAGRIDGIFDVKAAGYVPKPHAAALDAFVRHAGVNPSRAAMFEDIARNLAEPHARGMTTVLVRHEANTDAAGLAAARHPHDDPSGRHVHFITPRLTAFLAAVVGREREEPTAPINEKERA